MNVTQFLQESADLLDDASHIKYPQAMLIRCADRVTRSLHRTMVQGQKDYSNFELCLQKEAAVEVLDTEWEYRLPTWVTHVDRVWERNNASTTENTFSPYLWLPLGQATKGKQIERYAPEGSPHWSWQGGSTLRLSRYTNAIELIVSCVVQPPRSFKAKVATVPASTSTMYLAPTPSFGEIEIEEGAYINSYFEVTETANTNATHYGEVRRCVYSTAAKIVAGTRYHELTFDAAFSTILAIDDVVETIFAIPEQHTRLLVLKVAQECFQKKNNKSGLGAIAGELNEEHVKFQEYATTPRDNQGPVKMRRSLRQRPRRYIDGQPLSDYY